MKILSTIIAFILAALPAVAQQTGVDAISSSADGVSTYMPVVRMLCFSIAGVIAIVGAYTTYYAFHQGQDVQKRVMMTVGSAMTFLTMAIFLPKFFGYDDNGFDTTGLIAQNGGGGVGDSGTGTSSMAGDTPGVPGSGIDATIPDINDPKWSETHTVNEILDEYVPVKYVDYQGQPVYDLGRLWMDYSFYHGNPSSNSVYSHPEYYDSYRSDIDGLLSRNNYNFDAAYTQAMADYESCCEAYASGDVWPYGPSDYWRIAQSIEALQFISYSMTWEKKSGNWEPPPAGWENTFYP